MLPIPQAFEERFAWWHGVQGCCCSPPGAETPPSSAHTRLFHLLPRDCRSHAHGQTQTQAKPLLLWSHAAAGFGSRHGSHCTSWSQIASIHDHFYISAMGDGDSTIPGCLHPKETRQADLKCGPTQLRGCHKCFALGTGREEDVLLAPCCQTTLSNTAWKSQSYRQHTTSGSHPIFEVQSGTSEEHSYHLPLQEALTGTVRDQD